MANLYKEAVELLREISQNRNNIYEEDIEEIESLLNDDSYKIAVIGEFSVGKSTFLNSIIGKRVLYSSAQEATGVLTIIRNSEKMVADVIYDDNSVDTIDLSKEDSYSKLNLYLDKNRNDSRKINNVNINYPIMGIDKDVILLDTPGLQGIRDKELLITKNALKEANATIVLINYKGLTGTELSLLQGKLKEFGRIKTKEIILVINRIGELYDNVSNEEALIKINRVVESVNNTLAENDLNNVKVFALDSRDYLWGRDINLYNKALVKNDSNLSELLTQEEYVQRSNFNQFEEYLHNFLCVDNRTKAFYEDIKEKLLILLDAFKEELQNNNNESLRATEEILNKINTQKLLIIENRRAITNSTIRQLRESVEEFIRVIGEDIEDDAKASKRKVLLYIKDNIKCDKDLNIETKKRLRKFVQALVNESTNTYIKNINKYKSNINLLLNDTFNKEFKRIFSNNGNIKFTVNPSEANINLKYKESADDNIITELEKSIKENEDKLRESKQLLTKSSLKYNDEIIKLEKKIKDVRDERDSKISRLGPKPKPVQLYTTVPKTRKKWIFLTEKYDAVVPDRLDYSEGLAWEKDCDDRRCEFYKIERSYQENIDEISQDKLKKESLEKNIKQLEKHIEILKEQKNISIKKMQELIKNNKEMFLENKKEELYGCFSELVGKYFRMLINKLNDVMDDFYKYVNGEVKQQAKIILDGFEETLNKKYKQTIEGINNLNVDKDDILDRLINMEKSINMEV